MVKGLRKAKNVAPQAAGCYMLPLEYSATSEEPVVRAAKPIVLLARPLLDKGMALFSHHGTL